MSNAYLSPLKVGEISTNSQLAADLGKSYSIQGSNYVLVKVNTVAISNSGGKPLTRVYVAGVPQNTVQETTTLNDYNVAGVVPLTGGINSATALAAGTFLLLQRTGPGYINANSTIVAPAIFGTTTTASVVASIDSAVYAPGAMIGKCTNTAAASLAGGQPITCILTLGDG